LLSILIFSSVASVHCLW